MSINFNIVENPKEENKEEFIKDYSDGLTQKELSQKYSMSIKAVQHKIKRLGLPRRYSPNKPKPKKEPSFISLKNGKFWPRKTFNNKIIWFGGYETMEIAKQVVTELKKCNWDKSQLPIIKKRLGL